MAQIISPWLHVNYDSSKFPESPNLGDIFCYGEDRFEFKSLGWVYTGYCYEVSIPKNKRLTVYFLSASLLILIYFIRRKLRKKRK
jgi:hypothetical protein